ncbi:MAG: S8 family peptidase [Bacteroidales bacterium]|nr:S8 family peptidase [Bacteroidales bacterium]
MRRLIYSLIIALFVCNYTFAQNSIIEKELQEVMNEKSDEMISINIVFKSQIDTETLRNRVADIDSKTAKREATIKELKLFSEKSQQEVLSIIRNEERNGKSSHIKSHWLSNSITCNATKEVIYLLSQRDDIFIIGHNADKNVILANNNEQSAESDKQSEAEITSNVTQVNAPEVWEQGYTGEGVLVAILDSGVNYEHPDIADHLWDGGAQYPNHGYNSFDDNIETMDDSGHGTHCAGIICGDGTGGKQTGIAPEATLMCIKAINNGNANVNSIISGMEFAVEHGAQVLSMSLGIANSSISERTMLRQTCVNTLEAGVIASVACGNEGSSASNTIPNNVRVPGSCPAPWIHPDQQVNPGETSCVVSVGAVTNNDAVAGISSRGPVTWQNTSYGDYPYNPGIGLIRPDICAPGVDIVSLNSANNGYVKKTGTSQAAPCVAGVMCLMLSKDNTLTPAEISMILETTAMKLEENKNNDSGSGRVDALAAVNGIDMGPIKYISFSINDENGNNTINPGEEITLNVVVDNTSSESYNGITAVLTCKNEWINFTNPNAEIGNIGTTEFTSIDGQFRFILDEEAESKTPLYFDLEFYQGNEKISTTRFSSIIYDNAVRYSSFIVKNDDNGNGTLEAGETADLGVMLINAGNEIAVDLKGTLSSSSNLVTINENETTFNSIAPNGNATAYFNVTLAGNAGSSLDIPFEIEVKDKYDRTHNFSMNYVSTCDIVYALTDEFGDGWNGAKILVHYSDGSESDTYTITSGTSATFTKTLNSGVNVSLEWKKGGVDNECIYSINYANGTEIFSGKGRQDGVFFNWNYDCSCQNIMFQNGEGVSNFEIIMHNYSVELKWEAPETQDVLYYELYRDDMLIEVTEELSFIDENLSSGTYFYNVRPVYENMYGELVGDVVTFNVNTEEINATNADVYPNPSNDKFIVRCERMTNIVVFNILGNKIIERNIDSDSFEIDGLENGIYFVNIETENGSAVRKIVKY